MRVPEAWEYSSENEAGTPLRGKGIIIGQIDTGYSDHGCFTKGGMFLMILRRKILTRSLVIWVLDRMLTIPKVHLKSNGGKY